MLSELGTVELLMLVNLAGLSLLAFILAYHIIKSNRTLAATLERIVTLLVTAITGKSREE